MKPFDAEVAEILTHYHDVARAHGMDRALKEAVEAEVFTRRECAGLGRRVLQLEARLETDALDELAFLWEEYVQANPATLTEDERKLAIKVREKVRELAGMGKTQERVRELEEAIRNVIEDLRDHEDVPVYGPYGLADTRCVVSDSKVCSAVDELQAVLDGGDQT